MTTQEIIESLREIAAMPDYYVSVLEMHAAADRLEELHRDNDGLINEMDRLRAGWEDAIEEIKKKEDHITDLKSIDKKPLNEEMVKLISGMNKANAAQVKPEPSRLEIAAMAIYFKFWIYN